MVNSLVSSFCDRLAGSLAGPREPASDLPPPLARDILRGLLHLAAHGRGDFDTGVGVDIIRARLTSTLAAIENVAASAAAAHELIAGRISSTSVPVGVGGIHAGSASSDMLQAAADLTAQVTRAASIKTAALEREAVAIEAALEAAASIFVAARDAASSADASPAALSEATAGLESLLPALSSAGPLELGTLCLTPTGGSLLGLRLVAPRAFGADDVAFAPLPRHTRADSYVRLTLSVVAPPAVTDGWGDEEWSSALAHLASHTSAIAQMRMGKLPAFSEPSSMLPVTTSVDLASRGIVVSIEVPSLPDTTDPGAVVAELVCLVRVCGRPPVNGTAGAIRLPRHRGGVSTPLVLPIRDSEDIMYPKPAVSSDGRIFVPVHPDTVCVWSANGKPLADIPAHGVGGLHCVAVDDEAGILYLGGNLVVALDLHNPSAPPKWMSSAAAPAGDLKYGGIVPIPFLGVVIVVNYGAETAWALRASDGAILHSIGDVVKAIHICADPLTATLFSFTSSRGFPLRYRYVPGRGFETIMNELPPFPFSGSNFHPASWMPATPGLPACLVVGTWGSSEVLILGLPDCELLQRLQLVLDGEEAICVQGLACDPSGCALVVCDSRSSVIALPWPPLRLKSTVVQDPASS